jgi:hypothetical protein
MNRRQAIWQLLLVRAVIRRSREQGQLEPELRERAKAIVESTATEMATDGDGEWTELLAAIRAELERD